MAVMKVGESYLAEPNAYLGLSTDTKPTADDGVTEGSTFLAVDTKAGFIFHDGEWYVT